MGMYINPLTGQFDDRGLRLSTLDARYVNVTGDTMTGALFVDGSGDVVQLKVQAHSTQTVNLQEWQNSSGSVLMRVDEIGWLGIGTGVSNPSGPLHIVYSPTDTATTYGQVINSSLNPSADTSVVHYGQLLQLFSTGNNNYTASGGLRGVYALYTHTGNGTVANGYGLVAQIQTNTGTTGVITNAAAFQILAPSRTSGTNTITSLVGVNIGNQGNSFITNSYGLYIQGQSGSATLNYAIFTNTGLNELNDQLFVDGSADRIQLIVQAHSTQTTNLQEWQNSAGTTLMSVNGAGTRLSFTQSGSGIYVTGGDFVFSSAVGNVLRVQTTDGTTDAGLLYIRSNSQDIVKIGDTGATNDGGVQLYNSDGTTRGVLLRSAAGSYILNGLTIGSVTVGSSLLNVIGSSDIVQASIKAHSTQTSDIFVIESSGGTDYLTVSGTGEVGIGDTTDTSRKLKVKKTFTDTVDVSGALNVSEFTALFNPASASSANIRGGKFYVNTQGAQSLSGEVQVFFAQFQHSNTNTLATATGFRALVQNLSTGTITTARGAVVGSVGNSGGGSVGTVYGLYVEGQTVGGTANYAIFTNAGLNELNDQLFVDGSADRIQLIVQAHSTQTNNIFVVESSGGTDYFSIGGSGKITHLYTTTDPSSQDDGIFETTDLYVTGAMGQNVNALRTLAQFRGGANIAGALAGFRGTAYNNSANSIANVYGMTFKVGVLNASATITNLYGIEAGLNNTANGTIGTYKGVQLSSPTGAGTATITNIYGIYIDDITHASTLNYAIYTNSGAVRLGDTTTTTGRKKAVAIKSADYTLTTNDEVVVFTATATATLPAATGTGQTYRIVCRAGTLTIDGNSTDTIKGSLTQTLTSAEDLIITDTASGIWE